MTFISKTYRLEESKPQSNSNEIGYLLYGIIIVILLLEYLLDGLNGYGFAILILCLIGIVILRFSSLFKTKKASSSYLGGLEMDKDRIKLFNRQFDIGDLKKVKIVLQDFENKVQHRSELDFRGIYAEGVNNLLKFEASEKEHITVRFKLNHKNHRKDLKEFVLAAIQQGLLSIEEGKSVIGLENYKEIQDFRKAIMIHKNMDA